MGFVRGSTLTNPSLSQFRTQLFASAEHEIFPDWENGELLIPRTGPGLYRTWISWVFGALDVCIREGSMFVINCYS